MSKSSVVFPYGISLSEDGKLSVFPAVEIDFITNRGETIALIFLIDSGATVSALPKSDAEVLGLSLNKDKWGYVQGVGGEQIFGYETKIIACLGSEKFSLPLIFLENNSVPRILGREEVFSRFTIIFEEEKHRTAFLSSKSKAAVSVRKILGNI